MLAVLGSEMLQSVYSAIATATDVLLSYSQCVEDGSRPKYGFSSEGAYFNVRSLMQSEHQTNRKLIQNAALGASAALASAIELIAGGDTGRRFSPTSS
jgi:hypothetical protein